jgi:hypothetical protein
MVCVGNGPSGRDRHHVIAAGTSEGRPTENPPGLPSSQQTGRGWVVTTAVNPAAGGQVLTVSGEFRLMLRGRFSFATLIISGKMDAPAAFDNGLRAAREGDRPREADGGDVLAVSESQADSVDEASRPPRRINLLVPYRVGTVCAGPRALRRWLRRLKARTKRFGPNAWGPRRPAPPICRERGRSCGVCFMMSFTSQVLASSGAGAAHGALRLGAEPARGPRAARGAEIGYPAW